MPSPAGGDDEAFVNADNLPISSALFTGTYRAVETEKVFARLFENHPVRFEQVGKGPEGIAVPHEDISVSLRKCSLNGIQSLTESILIGACDYPVSQEIMLFPEILRMLQECVDSCY